MDEEEDLGEEKELGRGNDDEKLLRKEEFLSEMFRSLLFSLSFSLDKDEGKDGTSGRDEDGEDEKDEDGESGRD